MQQIHACLHLIDVSICWTQPFGFKRVKKKLALHSSLQQWRLCFGDSLCYLPLDYYYLLVYVHGISSLVTDFPQ